MKKILSLVMVVAMLVAVLALVGCTDKNKNDSSSSSSSSSSSTSASSENTTASSEENTTASSEENTTASTEDTTASTEENTTASTEGTTSSSESETTETTESTTETTLPPVFARFDFGTDSKAQSLGMTSHDYLVEILTFNSEFINVTYTEDSIIVTAVKDHPEVTFDNSEEGKGAEIFNGYTIDSYALCYEDIITYDFDDCLTKTESFMRVRIKNQSTNNIMGIRWHHGSNAYATTMLASCMYLQGGAPTIEDYIAGETKKTCDPSDVYKTYTYDINFCAALARHGDRGEVYGNSYVHMAYYVGLGHSTGSNNWNWMGANECSSIQFLVLGAYGGRPTSGRVHYGYADTRANIVEGATVEIDYILFGASKANLNTFTSNIEDASVSASIAESISVSIAESEAAATATTAAA